MPIQYGVIKWIGLLPGEQGLHAGVEMVRHTYAVVVICVLINSLIVPYTLPINYLSYICMYIHTYLYGTVATLQSECCVR